MGPKMKGNGAKNDRTEEQKTDKRGSVRSSVFMSKNCVKK